LTSIRFQGPAALLGSMKFHRALLLPLLAGVAVLSALGWFVVVRTNPVAVRLSPPSAGIWLSPADLASRPMSGAAWESLISVAEGPLGTPDVADQDSTHDTKTLATALAAARTGRDDLRAKATDAIVSAIGTERGARWLAVGRNLGAYVIVADVLNLREDRDPESAGSRVQKWLASFMTRRMVQDNDTTKRITLRQAAWRSGSNPSSEEGFVHASIAAYLGDEAALAWDWAGFRRFAGDRSSPHHMTSNDLSWQYRPADPVGIMDAGAVKDGCRMDGAVGNDMYRGGPYSCTPGYTQYPWVGLEGSVPAAEILKRAGYPAFEIQSQAIRRAVEYLWQVREATADARWFDGRRANEIIWLVNKEYGANFLFAGPASDGRTVGWTDWTHQ
jgi:hypothetical protein